MSFKTWKFVFTNVRFRSWSSKSLSVNAALIVRLRMSSHVTSSARLNFLVKTDVIFSMTSFSNSGAETFFEQGGGGGRGGGRKKIKNVIGFPKITNPLYQPVISIGAGSNTFRRHFT